MHFYNKDIDVGDEGNSLTVLHWSHDQDVGKSPSHPRDLGISARI